MSYEQALKHSKNHRKDRFHQQCSGYAGDGVSHQKTEEDFQRLAKQSFERLLNEAKTANFPIYIKQSGGWHYSIVDNKNLFGEKISSYEELVQFGRDYVGCTQPSTIPLSLTDRINVASERSKTTDTDYRGLIKDDIVK